MRTKAYQTYVTKSLQLIPQSKFISKNLSDFVTPSTTTNKTGGEIASDVIAKAGLTFGD